MAANVDEILFPNTTWVINGTPTPLGLQAAAQGFISPSQAGLLMGASGTVSVSSASYAPPFPEFKFDVDWMGSNELEPLTSADTTDLGSWELHDRPELNL